MKTPSISRMEKPPWFYVASQCFVGEVMRDLGQIPDTHPKWIMLDGHLAEIVICLDHMAMTPICSMPKCR